LARDNQGLLDQADRLAFRRALSRTGPTIQPLGCCDTKDPNMALFRFHICHGDHTSDHDLDLLDVNAAHEEATMILCDMARDVTARFREMPEWRMDVSDFSGKSLFALRLHIEALNQD
jgi:hypothetical protein